jgi:alpha-glucosidase
MDQPARDSTVEAVGLATGPNWYQSAVFYQIYPLSFQDSDGDGKGDIQGILSRLDHLTSLGVDAVWLGPVYPSPMDDLGYDISDFEGVDPVFGRLSDMDELLRALHERRIRLVLDFVPNHTSSAHPWFSESRSSRDNPRHDWYIWADAKPDGSPPSNWLSRFGGSAWTWEPRRQQYYCHSFLASQPDLNWHNPAVRSAMKEALRFWLRRGVDGFRIDAAAVLAKDPLLREDPPNPDADESTPPPQRLKPVSNDARSQSLVWLRELRSVTDEFDGTVLLGEVDTAPELLPGFYGTPAEPILHLPLNYLLLDSAWDASTLADRIREYLDAVPAHGGAVWAIGGQDKKRIASRVGPFQARNVAMLALTMRGAPLIYAGDELGMGNTPIPSEEAVDAFERRVPGYGLNRDPERTPMQWDDGPNAGFTTGTPWLRLGPDHRERNVREQARDPRSLFNLYRALVELRGEELALARGTVEDVASHGSVLSYVRRAGARRLLVALNLSHEAVSFGAPEAGRLLISTMLDRTRAAIGPVVDLRADEGIIVELPGASRVCPA